MARHRVIKPEFFSSEQIAECSPNARLLFIGLWCFCDDGGVHAASPTRLKMEVFPADPCDAKQVAEWVSELEEQGLIETYVVGGKEFWRVTGWHHQKIEKPTYNFPRSREFGEEATRRRRMVVDPSAAEGSGGEWSGGEWSGGERKGVEFSNSDGKAIGSAGDVLEDSRKPPQPSLSQSPKRFVRNGEAFDLGDLDWSAVVSLAESVARKIRPFKDADRRMWLKAAVLASVRFSEHWLMDSVDAVLNARETKRTKQAHLVGVWKRKAIDDEKVAEEEYESWLGRIEIPDEIWKSNVVEVRRGA